MKTAILISAKPLVPQRRSLFSQALLVIALAALPAASSIAVPADCPYFAVTPVKLADAQIGVNYYKKITVEPGKSTGSMLHPRFCHTATLLKNGKVLVTGGCNGDSLRDGFLGSELFDPSTGTWSETGVTTEPRMYHTATLLADGRVLVTGGYFFGTQMVGSELYDPATGTWSTTGSLNVGRSLHCAALLRDGKVLVAGGCMEGSEDSDYAPNTDSAEIYDPATGKWTLIPPMKNWSTKGFSGRSAGDELSATVLSNGCVIITDPRQLAVELYDPALGTWSEIHESWWKTQPIDFYRNFWGISAATLLADGKVLAVSSDAGWFGGAEVYDPTSGSWTTGGGMTASYYARPLTRLPDGRVLATGGFVNFKESDAGDIYDPTTGTWNAAPAMREVHRAHSATLLPNGQILVAGGMGLNHVIDGYSHWDLSGVEFYEATAGGPYTFAMTAGSLPIGLTLSNDGILSGVPSRGGTTSFTITAADANGCAASQDYSFTVICSSIQVNQDGCALAPAAGTLGVPYSFTNKATMTASPYSFSITQGSLPPGLSMTSDGVISGTPTQTGNFQFTLTVADANECVASRNYLLPITTDPYFNGPSVSIAWPTNFAVSSRGVMTVCGLARLSQFFGEARVIGNRPCLKSVLYSVNGGTPMSARIYDDCTEPRWTANNVVLESGWNTFTVQAFDQCGNGSAIVTNSYFCDTPAPLTVIITDGCGGVSMATGKKLKLGATYTISATPAANYVFSNWVNCSTGESADSDKYTFVMRPRLVLTASFATNPAVGNYCGLFCDASNVTHQSSGFMKLTLNPRNAFSASMIIEGDAYSLSGKLSHRGRTNIVIPRFRQGKEALTVCLDAFSQPNQIVGMVSNSCFSVPLSMERGSIGATTDNGNLAGKYTFLAPATNAPANGPGGHSYAALVVAGNGALSVGGALADSTPISQGVSISKQGHWPFYTRLYPAKYFAADLDTAQRYTNSGYNGAVFGWITFSNQTPSGTVSWIKTSWTNQLYPNGFTNYSSAIGSPYVPPPSGTRMVAITNGLSVVTDGSLIPQTNNIALNSANLVIVSNNPNRLSVSLSPKNGFISGSFSNAALGKMTPFKGAVLQQQAVGGGWAAGTNQSGWLLLQPAP